MRRSNKKGLFERLDEKLEGKKLYDFYWHHIWAPFYRIFIFKPRSFLHKVRLFFQRGRLGYTHEDYWCLNYHLAKYLAGVLRDWSVKVNSYPGKCEKISFTEEEWVLFLTTSAEAFQDWIDIEEGDDPYCQKEETKKKHDRCMKVIRRFFLVTSEIFETMWD